MATTIRDVARAASVSIGTVSRALKNQPGLSDATRLRVVEAARQLGYDHAQLRPRIRRLTFLLHRQHNNFAASPFFSHVLHGVEDACRERGIVPSVLTAGPTEDVIQQMRLHAPDAVAIAGFVEPETLTTLVAMQRPLVLIDLWAPGLRSVNLDNAAGAALAMQHLFAQQHKRIAFIGGSLAHFSIAQRALGYRRAFFEAGLLFDPSLEVTIDAGLDPDTGAAIAMQRLLDTPGPAGQRPDAVFAYNDAAAHATPPLSTISVDKEALGRRGVELLLEESPAELEVHLPVHLIARASTSVKKP
jgi:DNA-binding LacI/PurR family transcriptional regulator